MQSANQVQFTEVEYKKVLQQSKDGELTPEKMEQLNLYRLKRIEEISRKVNLGIIQVMASIKGTPWCSRVAICFELLFKIKNTDFNEFGEYIGQGAEKQIPWCVTWSRVFRRFFSGDPNA